MKRSLLLLTAAACLTSSVGWAQDYPGGSPGDVQPGTEKPKDEMHGEAKPGAAAPVAPMANAKPFTLEVMVEAVGADWEAGPAEGASVKLEAYAGPTVVKTYDSTANAAGTARFANLRAVPGARFLPKVIWDGVVYRGRFLLPESELETQKIQVFPKTYDPAGVVVTDMATTVDLSEKYLIFAQRWTFVNTVPKTFDVEGNLDERFAEGLMIRLPKDAEGAHADILVDDRPVAEGKIVEDKVFVNASVPPSKDGRGGLVVQLRYSIKLNGQDFSYEQPVDWEIREANVVVPLTTNFARVPRLDLTLDAPSFGQVGSNKGMSGLRQDLDFLIARDRSMKPGEMLRFEVKGYPVRTPMGRWWALGLALAIVFAGGALLTREMRRFSGRHDDERLKALERERESLFEQLLDLEDAFEAQEVSDRRFDIESARLRERLALVMRRLEDEQASGDRRPKGSRRGRASRLRGAT